jgi:maltooligosyltrehalose trehalohydrolase
VRRARIPDPQAAETFARSRLDWDEARRPPHALVRQLYQRLLHARVASAPVKTTDPRRYRVEVLDGETLQLTLACGDQSSDQDVTAIVRLSGTGPVIVPGAGGRWRDIVLTTEDSDVTNDPLPIRVDTAAPMTVHFERPGAIVFRGLPLAS